MLFRSGGLPPWAGKAAQYGAISVLGIVLLLVARSVLKGLESSAPREVLTPEIVPEGETAAAEGGGRSRTQLIRDQVSDFVGESPEEAGRLLEGWIQGEE